MIVLRRRQPGSPRPYRTPGYPVVPLVFVTVMLALVVNSLREHPEVTVTSIGAVLAGVPLYYGWRYSERGVSPAWFAPTHADWLHRPPVAVTEAWLNVARVAGARPAGAPRRTWAGLTVQTLVIGKLAAMNGASRVCAPSGSLIGRRRAPGQASERRAGLSAGPARVPAAGCLTLAELEGAESA